MVFIATAFLLTSQMFATQPMSIRKVVQAAVSDVYIPTGFDENDTPQFIVEGKFPNACYELKGAKTIRKETKEVEFEKTWFEFWIEAYESLPQDCDEKKQKEKDVPYIEVVTLPKQKKGNYEIWNAQNKSAPLGILAIAEAPKGTVTDSFLYANVTKANLEKDELKEGHYLLMIEGTFPSNCHEIDLTETQFINKTPRIIEVLPVIKKFKEDGCETRAVDFGRILPVPKALTEKNYLFHIRIARGRALNLKTDMSDLTKQIIHKDPKDDVEHTKTETP